MPSNAWGQVFAEVRTGSRIAFGDREAARLRLVLDADEPAEITLRQAMDGAQWSTKVLFLFLILSSRSAMMVVFGERVRART